MSRHEAAENNIKIGVVEHENVPMILGDPEFLRSVFNNLLSMPFRRWRQSGGHLNIKITRDNKDGFVRVDISDTGSGISDDNLSKIFEPYFSTKETGTGLGLAIVHKIVEMHKGIVTVESVAGNGTKFTVKLPEAGKELEEDRARRIKVGLFDSKSFRRWAENLLWQENQS